MANFQNLFIGRKQIKVPTLFIMGLFLVLLFLLVLPTTIPSGVSSLSLLSQLKSFICSCSVQFPNWQVESENVLYSSGRIHYLEGDLKSAEYALSQISNPSDREALNQVLLGDIAYSDKNELSAIKHWKEAGAANLLLNRANDFGRDGEENLAVEFFILASLVNPKPQYVDAAWRYFRRQNNDSAEKELFKRVALASGPDSPMGLRMRGQAALVGGHYAEAEDFLLRSTQKNSNDSVAFIHLAWAARRLGHFALSEEAYLNAIGIDPEDANNYASLGDLYVELGLFQESIEMYQLATKFGEYWGYWDRLAQQYRKVGRLQEADRICQEAIQKMAEVKRGLPQCAYP